MPIAVERIAKKYMRRPAVVTIGVAGQAVDTVEQRVEFILGDDKRKSVWVLYVSDIVSFIAGNGSSRFSIRISLRHRSLSLSTRSGLLMAWLKTLCALG